MDIPHHIHVFAFFLFSIIAPAGDIAAVAFGSYFFAEGGDGRLQMSIPF
jgi:hypothetical protein